MITDFFGTTARVDKKTKTQNDMGGAVYAYTPRIVSLACRLSKRIIREADQFGKQTVREIWRAYCAATTDTKQIIEKDRWVIGDDVYEVKGIYNPGNLDRHLEIDLERIH